MAAALGVSLSAHDEREVDGGERKMRSLEGVRQRSVYVIQSLRDDVSGSANDGLCRLLFFIGALKDAGARQVTACVTYLAYVRKERRTKSRDPVTTCYVAQMIESVGTDRTIALDVHELAAFENAFGSPTVHLVAAAVFVQRVAGDTNGTDCVAVSRHIGGVKRARHFQESLQNALDRTVGLSFMN